MPKRYVTWNMEGGGGKGANKWTAVRNFFANNGCECAFLQECGDGPPETKWWIPRDDKNALGVGMWEDKLILLLDFGKNVRCSTAIILKGPTEKSKVAYSYYDPTPMSDDAKRRRLLIVTQTGLRGALACIHAPASPSSGAADYAKAMLERLRHDHEWWICAGDFNCESSAVAETSKWQVSAPTSSTHTAGKIDFAVASNSVGNFGFESVGTNSESDHLPVFFGSDRPSSI